MILGSPKRSKMSSEAVSKLSKIRTWMRHSFCTDLGCDLGWMLNECIDKKQKRKGGPSFSAIREFTAEVKLASKCYFICWLFFWPFLEPTSIRNRFQSGLGKPLKRDSVSNLNLIGFGSSDGPCIHRSSHPPSRRAYGSDRVFRWSPSPLASQEFVSSPTKLSVASLRDWPLPVTLATMERQAKKR